MRRKNWIDSMGITKEDALRISQELMERILTPGLQGIELLNRCREVISLGIKEYNASQLSVNFRQAVEISLAERADRRSRTVYEINQVSKRFMNKMPELGDMNMRDIKSSLCNELLQSCSASPLQFIKQRTILHSIFSCGIRHGWCSLNPVNAIPRPVISETEIEPLPWDDIKNLMYTVQKKEFIECSAAVGMMLWAGIRPSEVLRLNWEDIDWQEKVINMRPQHSKTGGWRHITMHTVLIEWLKKTKKEKGRICPPNWANRWKKLRLAAGINHWQQDVLRHTFASYHLKQWHNIGKLQEEMGHRSARLLMTRYLSMKGITMQHVKEFWTPGKLG